MLVKSMIIDIHAHPSRDRKALRSMLEAARKAGIDKVCLLPIRGRSFERYFYTNEEMKNLVKEYSDWVIGFSAGSCIDPNGAEDLEKAVRDYGLKGVKIHEERNWVLKGLLGCHGLLRKAGELGVPVIIHSWHEEEGLPPGSEKYVGLQGRFPVHIISEVARKCPDTILIFAHMGGNWEKALQAAKPHENVYFDTCGFDPIIGVVERAVEVLGPERILFGSDAPGRSFVAQLSKIQYADISERDRRLILGENAMRILGLR
ncbi:amidohydrolase [Candidatus Bathyarchaeota archaeon]|nr:amidohydrolase [Candidatus Bathyarchaeota archaeon]